MKNTFVFIFAISSLALIVLACSSINPQSTNKSSVPTPSGTQPFSNRSTTDRPIETSEDDEKIGIPECDEVMDMLAAEANNPDDNYIVKAGKAVVFNRIKQTIKESVEKSKGNTDELTKTCKDAKFQLQKAKAEQDSKGGK
ncbi:MAG: hypothetical protein ABJA02_08560 [Acidobacteriota bacterium]